VIFEVRATLVGGYYEFQIPSAYSKFKKGGLMTVNWSGGEPAEKVMIDLYKGDSKFSAITPNVENEGKFVWTVPKQVKSGGDYKVKITNTSNYNNTGISAEFKISPKIPMVAKVGVGAAVVGTAIFLATRPKPIENGNGNGNGDGDSFLPAPPPPPTSGN
ncbi:Ser-Thr-rich GPI-anchored membrane family protein, partial [Bacteroidota bacterium]